jgi:hypothetical protein
MTAAEAAAASGAAGSGGSGAGAGTGAGAAGGGGGGLSVTTIGIIGGAAAAGGLLAAKTLGGPGGTAYTGQFSGPIVVTGPPPFCGFTQVVSGMLVMRIEEISTSSVKGTAEVDEDVTLMYSPTCRLTDPPPSHVRADPSRLTGTRDNLGFNYRHDNTFTAPDGQTGIRMWSLSFTGAFNGSEIVGVLTNTEANESTRFPGVTNSGTTAFPITLR